MTFTITQATVEDAETLAALHVPSKQKAYAGLVDAAYLNAKTVEEYTANWTKWISDPDNPITVAISYEDEAPAGFIAHGPLRTPPPGTSKIRPQYPVEIYAVHVHPDFWRGGHGTQLLRYAAAQIKADKKNAFCLWALKGNSVADGFYMKHGAQKLGKRDIEAGPTKIKEICYGWRDLSGFLS